MARKIKRRIFLILEAKEHKQTLSRACEYFLIFLIISNTLAVCIESIEEIFKAYEFYFIAFNRFSVGVFTLEYLLRVWSCTTLDRYRHPIWGRLRYMVTPLAIIDLIAFLPFYLPFTNADLRSIKLFGLTRFLQLLKLGRYSRGIKILGEVIHLRQEELILTLNIVCFLLISSATLIYFVEHEAQPDKFPNIPAAMWWGIITLTTVGYGDIYPITPLGKILGGILALLGIGLFALPAGLIASGFTEVITANKKLAQTPPPRICPHCGKPLDETLNNPTHLRD
ncbi:Putative potassium channel protein RPA4233 [Planktothrix tepida]|uniref:Ion transport protein n=2 Tax=Planktothrix TaxID=54304 RepID=A0A1J1LM30_9CYAN|nr:MULTISPECIES: ion transporter [Planktothrix]CAD5938573.1 Putative potassium channel protein RPA4233 [Planktothrix tepida]CAD5973175.1 Putative potassium channel protein RPA4233 [Planktothrix pseudagardhii]CUR33270.1 Ion transport protein [Planktothrix tepida PCC 9214]